MDIESQNRNELMNILAESFTCYQEVQLRHRYFAETKIRADVVAISKDSRHPVALAFEVKVPSGSWEFKNWSAAFKQASDYVFATPDDERLTEASGRCLIAASFVYPGPDLTPWQSSDQQTTRFYRDYDREALLGVQMFAQHIKVGVARRTKSGKSQLELRIGTDRVFLSGTGFADKALKRLTIARLGSRQVEIPGLLNQ